jgi:hypothetical protein
LLHALNHPLECSDLDTIAAAFLGAVKGMIGLCQQIGNIKRPLLAMNQPDANRRAVWMTVHVLGRLGEAFANPLSHFDPFLATGLSEHGEELGNNVWTSRIIGWVANLPGPKLWISVANRARINPSGKELMNVLVPAPAIALLWFRRRFRNDCNRPKSAEISGVISGRSDVAAGLVGPLGLH